MEYYYEILLKTELLKNIDKNDLKNLLDCLCAKKKIYSKNEIILNEGDAVDYFGIILSGEIDIVKFDFFGNKNIILNLKSSEMFGESLIFSKNNQIPFSLEAKTNCEVLIISGDKILNPCCLNCTFHMNLIKNLVYALSNKNSKMTKKINLLTLRSLKEKILNLLYFEMKVQNSKIITLDMSRQEMADYLSADRAALSRELSRLKNENILDYNKNIFKILV